jgi:hypothetical protein
MEYAKAYNGEIIVGPCSLPCKEKNCLGQWVTGFNCLTLECLKKCNWLPVEYAEKGEYQRYSLPVIEESRVFYPVEDWSEAEILTAQLQDAVTLVTESIQARVDVYNVGHGLMFTDVHNCESYSRVTGYSHQQFCTDVWLWSVAMWEAARAIQVDVISGNRTMPTATEFIAELPAYAGVE